MQAQKFGARVASPSQAARLDTTHEPLRIMLTDDTAIEARAVVIATGARYRSLPLDRWAEFEGAGICFAATELEATACGPGPVAVVGGANSAGQGVQYLAGRGNAVTLIVRGNDLAAGMSSYLADRILAHAGITVRTATEVTALHGGGHLEAITVYTAAPGDDRSGSDQPCRGLFCFAGATPCYGLARGHRCR